MFTSSTPRSAHLALVVTVAPSLAAIAEPVRQAAAAAFTQALTSQFPSVAHAAAAFRSFEKGYAPDVDDGLGFQPSDAVPAADWRIAYTSAMKAGLAQLQVDPKTLVEDPFEVVFH